MLNLAGNPILFIIQGIGAPCITGIALMLSRAVDKDLKVVGYDRCCIF